jgi:hypothetical protein
MVADRYTFAEVLQALRPVRVKASTLTAWIMRGQVYGLGNVTGRGSGSRRLYSSLAVSSMALMAELTGDPINLSLEAVSTIIIPQVWLKLAELRTEQSENLWAIRTRDTFGPVITLVFALGDVPAVWKGKQVEWKKDLFATLELVAGELEDIKATRSLDDLLPRSELRLSPRAAVCAIAQGVAGAS